MNIGIVTTWMERGGAMVSRAYRNLLAPHMDVLIYARGGEEYPIGDPNWDQPYVTWAPRVKGQFWFGIHWPHFRRWIEANDVRLILFNEQRDWRPIVLARRRTAAVLAAYVDYYTAETVPLFDVYDVLFCNTSRHYSVFREHPGVRYLPWGTDCRVFTGPTRPVQEGVVTFFHSAGMNPIRKGTQVALEAFHALKGNCRFVLHTQMPPGRYPGIDEICRRDPRIEVVHETVPAPGLYHRGDVYVYPTILDGIGLTVAEALACGLPVIATDTPPMSEFVVDAENGRLVRPVEYRGRADGYYWAESYCSPQGVREAMQYYLERRGELPDLKRRAQEYARTNLDWSKNAADLPRQIEALVAAGRKDRNVRRGEDIALKTSWVPRVRRHLRSVLDGMGLAGRDWAQRMIYG